MSAPRDRICFCTISRTGDPRAANDHESYVYRDFLGATPCGDLARDFFLTTKPLNSSEVLRPALSLTIDAKCSASLLWSRTLLSSFSATGSAYPWPIGWPLRETCGRIGSRDASGDPDLSQTSTRVPCYVRRKLFGMLCFEVSRLSLYPCRTFKVSWSVRYNSE